MEKVRFEACIQGVRGTRSRFAIDSENGDDGNDDDELMRLIRLAKLFKKLRHRGKSDCSLLNPVASLGAARGRTAPGNTFQGGDTRRKKIVSKFTKNSGETRSDR